MPISEDLKRRAMREVTVILGTSGRLPETIEKLVHNDPKLALEVLRERRDQTLLYLDYLTELIDELVQ